MKNYPLLQQKFMVNTYPYRGLTLVRGDGMYLYDEKDNQYLDLMSNYGVNVFGYNHPVITQAIIEQLQKVTTLHGSFANDARAEASMALARRCGKPYEQVYWSNSGAEAVEAALKFAVLATGKKHFISCKKGYHGKTLGALSPTDGEKYRNPFEPLLWKFSRIPFNNLEALEEAITQDTAAFIVEPVQGEGGIIPPEESYLQQVREICTKHGILLIFDEIQSGMGRTGTFLASHQYGVAADIVTLGKGLAGGMPVGATVVTKEIAQHIPKTIHTSTFGGNPLTCAATKASLEILDEEMLSHVNELGAYFLEKLQSVQSPQITAVRGAGLMIGLEVRENRNGILKKLQEQSILVIPAGENVVRFLPPYLITKDHVDEVVQIVRDCFASLAMTKR